MIITKPIRTLVAGALLSALPLSFANVASAGEATIVPQVTVKYSDLDLSTSQGGQALYGRIRDAAYNVCWRMYDSTELYKLNKDACLQQVIANAVAKVGAPALSDVYASKYGASAPVVLASAATR